jgi:hypothetical protein
MGCSAKSTPTQEMKRKREAEKDKSSNTKVWAKGEQGKTGLEAPQERYSPAENEETKNDKRPASDEAERERSQV